MEYRECRHPGELFREALLSDDDGVLYVYVECTSPLSLATRAGVHLDDRIASIPRRSSGMSLSPIRNLHSFNSEKE